MLVSWVYLSQDKWVTTVSSHFCPSLPLNSVTTSCPLRSMWVSTRGSWHMPQSSLRGYHRVFGMGVPYCIHLAKVTSCQILGSVCSIYIPFIDSLLAFRCEHHSLGYYPDAPRCNNFIWGILRSPFSVGYAFRSKSMYRRSWWTTPSGMCESCVAPILILIISMFYKKDEQVSIVCAGI